MKTSATPERLPAGKAHGPEEVLGRRLADRRAGPFHGRVHLRLHPHPAHHSREAPACGGVLAKAGAPPPVAGNRVSLISRGDEAYRAVLGRMQAARDHIHAQFFILDVDPIGKRFIHALAARAKAGIRVRLLLDAVGSWRALRRLVRPLQRAGGEVAEFLPALPLHRKWSAHLRNHRKLLITDGMAAFCGGMNIGKNYMGPKREKHQWRDIGVVIHGPAVRDFQVVFLDDWAFATDETGPAGHLFPPPPPPKGGPPPAGHAPA